MNNIDRFLIEHCSFITAYNKLLEGYEVTSLQTHNRYKMEQMPITGYKKLYIFEKGQWKFRGYIQSSEIFNEWMVWDKGNGYECVDFDELNIDIKNDTTALLRLKNSNKPWVIYQINKDGMYYSFDNRLERIYTIGNDKLSEYDIKIIK